MGTALLAQVEETETPDEEIASLLGQYATCLESRGVDQWLELFVDECQFRVFSLDFHTYETLTLLIQCSGRTGLEDMLKKASEEMPNSRHVCSTPSWVRRVDGDLEVRTNFVVHQSTAFGQVKLFAVGQYRDVLTRSAGLLRFRQRDVVVDACGAPENISVPL